MKHFLVHLIKGSRHSENMEKALGTSKTGRPRPQCQPWMALCPSDNLGNTLVPSEYIGKL